VSLTAVSGYIQSTAQSGAIKADDLSLSATNGIIVATNASTLTASSTSGDIAVVQTGKALTLTSVITSAGGVVVSSDDNLSATRVQAVGSGKNVSLATTGTRKKITLAANSVFADGDAVTLSSTGGIDGTSNGSSADITAGTVSLTSTGGDVTATVKANSAVASALGIDADTGLSSDVDLKLIGTKSVFLGTRSGVTLAAAGDVTLRTGTNNIVVVATPTAGAGETIDLNTSGMVTFVVASSAASGAGSLAKAVQDGGGVTNTNPAGTVGVAFTTTVGSPIVLTSTIPVTSKLTLDGTQRINTTTGTLSTGRQVDIDGSRLVTGTAGFSLGTSTNVTGPVTTAAGSKISGFAFYGFNKAGGAGIELATGANSVTISNNLFGISSTGRVSSNANGIIAASVDALVVSGNTVVKSTDTGIKLTGVTNASVTGNLVGTNTTRTNLGNATGIQVNGTGVGNTVSGNVVSFNSVAGIHVNGADASAGTATVVRGNEVLLNKGGILVDGATKNATVAGNTVTRNTADGIKVDGMSKDVTIGGASATDRNYVGTTSANSLGLGNAKNGISVSSTGSGIVVQGNTVLGNGTANSANENAGVKFSGVTSNSSTVSNNIINSNRGSGVLAARTGSGVLSITNNTISSNSGSGVQVTSGPVVVGGSSTDIDSTLRANANTINSNVAYGVNVLSGAFAQIAGNSMTSNRIAGIYNPNLTPAPSITSVNRSASTGTLTVNFGGLANGQVVHVYSGTPQGRTYLGKFTAGGTNGVFTMTLAQQQSAGVAATIFAGAPITGTRTATAGSLGTSAFATVKSITRVA